jgi:hypothetical protein
MWILIALACWLVIATAVLALGRAATLVRDFECVTRRRIESHFAAGLDGLA